MPPPSVSPQILSTYRPALSAMHVHGLFQQLGPAFEDDRFLGHTSVHAGSCPFANGFTAADHAVHPVVPGRDGVLDDAHALSMIRAHRLLERLCLMIGGRNAFRSEQ